MNTPWQPVYENWNESAITLHTDDLETNSGAHKDYGVIFHGEVEEGENDSALFWIDKEHIYLRLDWANWYTVSSSDVENCTEICQRPTAVLTILNDSNIRMRPLKVYHIDELPHNHFAVPQASSSGEELSTDEALKESRDIFDCAAMMNNGMQFHSLHAYGRPVEFYELNGHLIIATFFPYAGEWLADENPVGNDEPYWVSADDAELSPYHIAKKIGERVRKVVPPEIEIESVICLHRDVKLMNEANYLLDADDDVAYFAYTEEVDDSAIFSIGDRLSRFLGTLNPEICKLGDAITAALTEERS